MLPPPPPTTPQNIHSAVRVNQFAAQVEFWRMTLAAIVMPMIAPPIIEASVPPKEIPPLVPGGTGFSVVISTGFDWESIPSSEARVSPKQHAKCLQASNKTMGFTVTRYFGVAYPRTPMSRALLQPISMALSSGHHAPSYTVFEALLIPKDFTRTDSKESGINDTVQAILAIKAHTELHSTCQPLRYPASSYPSSSSFFFCLPSAQTIKSIGSTFQGPARQATRSTYI